MHSSYKDHICIGQSRMESGDHHEAEREFAEALKLVHGKSAFLELEADCLHRIGNVYMDREKATKDGGDFTKAAALYHASLVRTGNEDFKKNLIQAINATEQSFLRYTVGVSCEVSTSKVDMRHRNELKMVRLDVKRDLDAIDGLYDPYKHSYDEDDPEVRKVEAGRAEAIRYLFHRIAENRATFLENLIYECINTIGLSPCKYAFIGLGSQATELVTPYSDLEFAVLIEEGKDSEETKQYFRNLTHYLHLKVIGLGETILPAMAIKSLNDFYSPDPEGSWFYDSITPRGLAFDGSMPWACKTPLGRQRTMTKEPLELIQTPRNMARFQQEDVAVAEGYHLSDVLRNACLIAGDETLVDTYLSLVDRTLTQAGENSTSNVDLIAEDMKKFNIGLSSSIINVKQGIYRFPGIATQNIALALGISATSVWDIIDAMESEHHVSTDTTHNLYVLSKRPLQERDNMARSLADKLQDLESRLEMGDGPEIEYGRALRDAIANMDLRIEVEALKCLGDLRLEKGRMTKNSEEFEKAITLYMAASFRCTDLDLRLTTQHRVRYLETLLKRTLPAELEVMKGLGDLYLEEGQNSSSLSLLSKAKGMYKTATTQIEELEAKEVLCHRVKYAEKVTGVVKRRNDTRMLKTRRDAKEPNKAVVKEARDMITQGDEALQNGDLEVAEWQFASALRLIHCPESTHLPLEAECLHRLGNVYLARGRLTKEGWDFTQATALYNAAIARTKHADLKKNCLHAMIEVEQSFLLNVIAMGIKSLNDYYCEDDVDDDDKEHGSGCWFYDATTPRGFAFDGAMPWASKTPFGRQRTKTKPALELIQNPSKMASFQKMDIAVSEGYHLSDILQCVCCISDKALRIIRREHGADAQDALTAWLLHNLGTSWSNLGDMTKAIPLLEEALKMRKLVYGRGTAHPDMMSSLHTLGRIWSSLGKHRKAIRFYEQALRMGNIIYGQDNAHPSIAEIVAHLGSSWHELGEFWKAIQFYENALGIQLRAFGGETAHRDIVWSFIRLGETWRALGMYKKSIHFHEQAHDMVKRLHGEETANPDVAASLQSMGIIWNELERLSEIAVGD
ncbi:KLC4 [Branchiostoma lanceolatum]|uniref:KLC4 protein n=1 Tax=Branchiostoma lanceolatum TaxID=7740 RepID=A0A8J9VH32_BRALA|nr:KLC4 [Branchiostoma lanceolatum]